MLQLGTLEELPQAYRDQLTSNNLVPLWPNMRAVLPPGIPSRKTQAVSWPFCDVRPLLLEAGELTPMEKAERRVLVLANPGHGLSEMQATPSIYMGMQLILPGETAPNHRHTPNAVRIVVEGEGAFSTVNGEVCKMEKGDLILTPSSLWHEHHHEGDGPIIWLDVLDLPLVYKLEASWAEEGETQEVVRSRDKSWAEYSAAGIVPRINAEPGRSHAPMLRYPWTKTRDCLCAMAEEIADELLSVAYVNPENGLSIFPSIGFSALMLRPGESVTLPVKTSAAIFHAVEGSGVFSVDGKPVPWSQNDTFAVPGYTPVTLDNSSSTEPAFLISADEMPLHQYLNFY